MSSPSTDTHAPFCGAPVAAHTQHSSDDGAPWTNEGMAEIADGMPLYTGMYSSVPSKQRQAYPSVSAPQLVGVLLVCCELVDVFRLCVAPLKVFRWYVAL